MSSEWAKNHIGVVLDDDKMAIIPRPTTELGIHVTMKTVQAGGLLGTLLVGPITAALKKETRNAAGLQQQMTRMGRGGLVVGLVLGPTVTMLAMRNQEQERIYDRCYRLRYNRGQVRVDRASALGAACGAGIGMAAGSSAMFGGLVGMSAGIILCAFYNSKQKTK